MNGGDGKETDECTTAVGVATPYHEQMNYIISSPPEKFASTQNIIFTSQKLRSLVKTLEEQYGKDIFLAGGTV